MIVRCAFHVHSYHSFDCFSSIQDLVEEAVKNGINLLAITDHDVVKVSEDEIELFTSHGIQFVQGCEVTTDRGAHIIGLGVSEDVLTVGTDPCAIVDAIRRGGGEVLIPHPFKPNSGFIARFRGDERVLDYVLKKSTLIESFNGGYRPSDREARETRSIARRYDLQVVAVSDAHKPWRLACNWTEYDATQVVAKDLSRLLRLAPSLLVVEEVQDQTRLAKQLGLLLGVFWRTTTYQWIVARVPFYFKSRLKRLSYAINRYRRKVK